MCIYIYIEREREREREKERERERKEKTYRAKFAIYSRLSVDTFCRLAKAAPSSGCPWPWP